MEGEQIIPLSKSQYMRYVDCVRNVSGSYRGRVWFSDKKYKENMRRYAQYSKVGKKMILSGYKWKFPTPANTIKPFNKIYTDDERRETDLLFYKHHGLPLG